LEGAHVEGLVVAWLLSGRVVRTRSSACSRAPAALAHRRSQVARGRLLRRVLLDHAEGSSSSGRRLSCGLSRHFEHQWTADGR
ncbi:hypothetical protein PMAYCL1PPCAC_28121, partial [Pristionchus mayeri]